MKRYLPTIVFVAAAGFGAVAMAEDEAPADCATLPGWTDACAGDVDAAKTVAKKAKKRLGKLGDCQDIKKKSEILECAANVAKTAGKLASAAETISMAHDDAVTEIAAQGTDPDRPVKGSKAKRSNSNRMEAEATDE